MPLASSGFEPIFEALKRKIIITCAIVLMAMSHDGFSQVLPTFGNSRSGTAGMQFLKSWSDARSAAMGGAVSALAQDPSAIYWNPAGMVKMDSSKLAIQLSSSKYFSNTNQHWVSVIFSKKKYTKFGLALSYNDFGSMMETTEFQPFGTGRSFSMNSYTITGSYAKVLTDFFSFGVNAKWAHEGLAGVNTNNLLFDLGLRYDLDVRNAKFAITLSNFGANVKPNGHMEVLKFSGQTDVNNYQRLSVPSVFRLGYAMDAWRGNQQKIIGSAQLNHYSDNNETFSLGAEYQWHQILYLRSGYEFGVDEAGIPSMGVGLRMQRRFGFANLDYSYSNKSRLGNVHRIGLIWSMR